MSRPFILDERVGRWDKFRGDGTGSRYVDDGILPGAGWWGVSAVDDKESSLWAACPCGCKLLLSLAVRAGYGSPVWTWTGTRERPTLHPSVQVTKPGGCGWHGHLTAGEWRPC